MTPLQIFDGSNGEATLALYKQLESLGPAGFIAMNLFRACKASGRAKEYRGRWKGVAYGKKEWSLGLLCDALEKHGEGLGIVWGWKTDPMQEFYPWVFYCELPTGQVSFHTGGRLAGPDYAGEWDQSTHSPMRIVKWTEQLLESQQVAA